MNGRIGSERDNFALSIYIPKDIIEKEICNSYLRNLVVTQTGYFEKAHGHCIHRNAIEEYIMIYCIDGNGWIDMVGRERKVNKGDIVFCNIRKPHGYGADLETPWSIYWAHFIGEGVEELFKMLNISEEEPIIHIGEKTEIITLMRKIHDVLSNGYSFPNLFYSSTCFQEIISLIIRFKFYSNLKSQESIYIDEAINYMLKNINSTFTLEQLAQYVKLSKFHFSRKFKERIGYSPLEYFNRLKIQKACELLSTTNLQVKEISAFLDFNNPLYFSEAFKRFIGISPAKYRNMQTNFNYKL